MVSALLMTVTACQKKIPKEESQKYLRAFDFELMRQVNHIMQSKAVTSLTPFFTLPDAPLPMISSNVTDSLTHLSGFDFEKAKGAFLFDPETRSWLPIATNAISAPLKLSYRNENDSLIHLYVEDYTEEPVALNMLFPTTLKGALYEGLKRLMTVDYKAEVKNGFPTAMDLQLSFNRYMITLHSTTHFKSHSRAELNIDLKVLESQKQILHVSLITDVAVDQNNTLTYNKKKIMVEAFPLVVKVRSDLDFTKIGGADFFNEWNKKSNILVYNTNNELLGNVLLVRNKLRDRVGLVMQYHDGSTDNLDETLLFVQKILDIKIAPMH